MHITKQTLDFLGDKFEVEQGEGGGRDAYLADHKIETYLIVPPKVSRGFSQSCEMLTQLVSRSLTARLHAQCATRC